MSKTPTPTIHVSLFSASIRDGKLLRRFYIYADGEEVGILVTTNKSFTELQLRKTAPEAVLALSPADWEVLARA